jgi:hypothetical protein
MSREKLEALLAGRPRPSGGMCLACLHGISDCSGLPFKDMPVMRRDKDGTPVVRCTSFVRQQPQSPGSKEER